MNLIGNSCVASFITRDFLKEKYKNPFCWTSMDFESIYNLIKKYDTIDFNNVKFINIGNFYQAILDNDIKINYIHYLNDDKCENLTFDRSNVKCKEILPYVKKKYFDRIKLIKEEEPIFILAAGYYQEYYMTDKEIQKIIDINSKYRIIISMPNTKNNMLKSIKNVKIANHNLQMNVDGVHYELAKFISKDILNLQNIPEKREIVLLDT